MKELYLAKYDILQTENKATSTSHNIIGLYEDLYKANKELNKKYAEIVAICENDEDFKPVAYKKIDKYSTYRDGRMLKINKVFENSNGDTITLEFAVESIELQEFENKQSKKNFELQNKLDLYILDFKTTLGLFVNRDADAKEIILTLNNEDDICLISVKEDIISELSKGEKMYKTKATIKASFGTFDGELKVTSNEASQFIEIFIHGPIEETIFTAVTRAEWLQDSII